MGGFNQNQFNTQPFNGPIEPPNPFAPPTVQTTISAPLVPPPQQFTNYATLIDGQANVAGVMIFRNGVLLTEGLDYSRSGGRLLLAVAPSAGDVMTAQVYAVGRQFGGDRTQRYLAPWTLPITGNFDGASVNYQIVIGQTIFGNTDGKNNLFTWGVQIPRGQVWRNGIIQTLNQDVVMGPNAMVFLPGAIPQPGDIITMLAFGYS